MNKKSGRNCKNRLLSCVFALLICLVLPFSLAGCDKNESVSKTAYNLYLVGCGYDEETLTVTAYVALSGTEEQRLEGVRAEGERKVERDMFYNRTNISLEINSPAIYAAVAARDVMTAQGEEGEEPQIYEDLKVALRYDTIYKSVVTNGVRHPSRGGFVHLLQLTSDEQTEFTLSQRTQNSANWYALLIAAGIVFFAAITAVYLANANRKEKREAQPQEVAYAEERRE